MPMNSPVPTSLQPGTKKPARASGFNAAGQMFVRSADGVTWQEITYDEAGLLVCGCPDFASTRTCEHVERAAVLLEQQTGRALRGKRAYMWVHTYNDPHRKALRPAVCCARCGRLPRQTRWKARHSHGA